MYLSRVELDLRNHETLRALNVPRRLHGAIEAAFEGPRTRHLWRLDRREGRLWLLILSEEVPELSGIVAQFGPPNGTAETRDYEPLLARVAEGTRWRFRLAANPIKNVKVAGGRGVVRNHVNRNSGSPSGRPNTASPSSPKASAWSIRGGSTSRRPPMAALSAFTPSPLKVSFA